MLSSGPTLMRPALSVSTPSHVAAGEAATPAAHNTVRASIRSPLTSTPLASMSSTLPPTRTSTPSASNERRAITDNFSSNVGSTRGPDCTSTTRACAGSKLRNSASMPKRASSAIAPASSTPVGPPPTIRKVSSALRSTGSSVISARSKAMSNRRRISVASSIRFKPGANTFQASLPK